jgi:hypothetical protein
MDVGPLASATASASSALQSTIAMTVLSRVQRDQQQEAEAILAMMQDSAQATADGHIDVYA